MRIQLYGKGEDAIGALGLVLCVIECAVMLLSLIPVEPALRKNFNKDGTRKISE